MIDGWFVWMVIGQCEKGALLEHRYRKRKKKESALLEHRFRKRKGY